MLFVAGLVQSSADLIIVAVLAGTVGLSARIVADRIDRKETRALLASSESRPEELEGRPREIERAPSAATTPRR